MMIIVSEGAGFIGPKIMLVKFGSDVTLVSLDLRSSW
jgi:hypothetical protein